MSRLGVGSPLRVSRQLQPLPSRIVTADVARQSLYVPVVISDLLPRRSVISRRPDVDEIPNGLHERPLDTSETMQGTMPCFMPVN